MNRQNNYYTLVYLSDYTKAIAKSSALLGWVQVVFIGLKRVKLFQLLMGYAAC